MILTWGYLREISRDAATPSISRHANIHDHNVRLESLHAGDSFVPGRCLANYFHVWICCQHSCENLTNQALIVHEQHANSRHTCPLPSYWELSRGQCSMHGSVSLYKSSRYIRLQA